MKENLEVLFRLEAMYSEEAQDLRDPEQHMSVWEPVSEIEATNKKRGRPKGIRNNQRLFLDGSLIHERRRELQLTLMDLAGRVNITPAQISNLEHEKLKTGASPEDAISIASVLGFALRMIIKSK